MLGSLPIAPGRCSELQHPCCLQHQHSCSVLALRRSRQAPALTSAALPVAISITTQRVRLAADRARLLLLSCSTLRCNRHHHSVRRLAADCARTLAAVATSRSSDPSHFPARRHILRPARSALAPAMGLPPPCSQPRCSLSAAAVGRPALPTLQRSSPLLRWGGRPRYDPPPPDISHPPGWHMLRWRDRINFDSTRFALRLRR